MIDVKAEETAYSDMRSATGGVEIREPATYRADAAQDEQSATLGQTIAATWPLMVKLALAFLKLLICFAFVAAMCYSVGAMLGSGDLGETWVGTMERQAWGAMFSGGAKIVANLVLLPILKYGPHFFLIEYALMVLLRQRWPAYYKELRGPVVFYSFLGFMALVALLP